MAPVKAGWSGAPARNATMRPARIGADSIGIVIVQCNAVVPMSRDIQAVGGTTSNSTTTPTASKTKGAISQSASALGLASGRASRSVSRSDGKANAKESTNFSQKRIVLAAAAISGLGPSNRK